MEILDYFKSKFSFNSNNGYQSYSRPSLDEVLETVSTLFRPREFYGFFATECSGFSKNKLHYKIKSTLAGKAKSFKVEKHYKIYQCEGDSQLLHSEFFKGDTWASFGTSIKKDSGLYFHVASRINDKIYLSIHKKNGSASKSCLSELTFEIPDEYKLEIYFIITYYQENKFNGFQIKVD